MEGKYNMIAKVFLVMTHELVLPGTIIYLVHLRELSLVSDVGFLTKGSHKNESVTLGLTFQGSLARG